MVLPNRGWLRIVRVRVIFPLPQVRVQAPNTLQSLIVQTHSWRLQDQNWVDAGQAAPPYSGATMVPRVRRFRPPLHSTVQFSNGPHAPTTQSMGQGWVLQGTVWFNSVGHAMPPYRGSTTVLVRVVVPLGPQEAVQTDQRDHGLTTQSMGQGCVLQFIVSLSGGMGMPPYIGNVVTVRVRMMTAPPQETEHVAHGPQGVTTASMGQGCVLQGFVSVVMGQGMPPWRGDVVIALVWVVVPAPHVTVQVDHASHGATTQSIGQG